MIHYYNRSTPVEGELLYEKLLLEYRDYDYVQLDTFYMENYTVSYIPYRFRIRATAEGGAYSDMKFEVRLIICGWEDITLPDDLDHTIYYNDEILFIELHTDSPFTRNYPLPPLFNTNDTDCPPIEFMLKEEWWHEYWYWKEDYDF